MVGCVRILCLSVWAGYQLICIMTAWDSSVLSPKTDTMTLNTRFGCRRSSGGVYLQCLMSVSGCGCSCTGLLDNSSTSTAAAIRVMATYVGWASSTPPRCMQLPPSCTWLDTHKLLVTADFKPVANERCQCIVRKCGSLLVSPP